MWKLSCYKDSEKSWRLFEKLISILIGICIVALLQRVEKPHCCRTRCYYRAAAVFVVIETIASMIILLNYILHFPTFDCELV